VDVERVEPVTVLCQECGLELAADNPDLCVELTDDDQLVVYCEDCWLREFGESGSRLGASRVNRTLSCRLSRTLRQKRSRRLVTEPCIDLTYRRGPAGATVPLL
jgi:hypothetical protein